MSIMTTDLTKSGDSGRRPRGRGSVPGSDGSTDSAREMVRCFLESGSWWLPIDVPRGLLAAQETRGGISLRVPGAEPLPVVQDRNLSPADERWADGWIAEMESFDRF